MLEMLLASESAYDAKSLNSARKFRRNLDQDTDSTFMMNFKYVYLQVQSERSSITVFSLLPHEQRMSVQHSSLQRHPQCDMVVKSKEEILMQVTNVWYFITGGFLGGIKRQSGDPIEQLL